MLAALTGANDGGAEALPAGAILLADDLTPVALPGAGLARLGGAALTARQPRQPCRHAGPRPRRAAGDRPGRRARRIRSARPCSTPRPACWSPRPTPARAPAMRSADRRAAAGAASRARQALARAGGHRAGRARRGHGQCRRSRRGAGRGPRGLRRRRPDAHRVPVHRPRPACRPRTSSSPPMSASARPARRQAGDHPHARRRRRQAAAGHQPSRRRAIRSSACAACACAWSGRSCSGRRCARCCAPRRAARCKVMLPMVATADEIARDARDLRRLPGGAAGARASRPRCRRSASWWRRRRPPSPSTCSTPISISIGSNDLTQYVMAAARDAGGRVAALNDPRHPGRAAADRARWCAHGQASGKPVSLCGDMASDPALLPMPAGGRPAAALGGAGRAGPGQAGGGRGSAAGDG